MARGKLGLVGVAGLVVLLGCAQKKDLPPRGTVFGTAQLSRALVTRYARTGGYKTGSQCLQAVQYNDGSKVIEVSSAVCPANGALSDAPVVAVLKLYSELDAASPTDATYLVMGNSIVLDQNTAVATAKNIPVRATSLPKIEVGDLCLVAIDYEEDFTKHCVVKFGLNGLIASIEFNKSRPFNRTTKHNELVHRKGVRNEIARLDRQDATLQKNIDTVQTNLNKVETTLTTSITSLRADLEKTAKELRERDVQLTGLISALDGKLAETAKELREKDIELGKSIATMTKTLEDLTTEVHNEDKAIRKEIADKVAGIKTELGKVKDDFTQENVRIVALITTLRGDMTQAQTDAKVAAQKESTRIDGNINKLQTETEKNLTAAVDAQKKENTRIDGKVDTQNTDLGKKITDATEAQNKENTRIEGKVDTLKTELGKKMTDATEAQNKENTRIEGKVDTLKTDLGKKMTDATEAQKKENTRIDGKVDTLNTDLGKKITDATEAQNKENTRIDGKVDTLKTDTTKAQAEAKVASDKIRTDLSGEIDKTNTAIRTSSEASQERLKEFKKSFKTSELEILNLRIEAKKAQIAQLTTLVADPDKDAKIAVVQEKLTILEENHLAVTRELQAMETPQKPTNP